MKKKNLNNVTEKELVKMLDEKRAGLRQFRAGILGGKAKNVREGRVIRKDIARIMTVLVAAAKSAKSAKAAK